MITRKFRNDSKCGDRVRYAFGNNHEHKCDSVTFVGGNVYSDNSDDLAVEMEIPTTMRKSALDKGPGRCGAHYMLSLQKGEQLSVSEWRDILDTTMAALGYTKDHKYFGVIHEDTGNQHMHIVANRISMDNHLLINESKDYETMMATARDLELKYNAKIEPTVSPEKTWGTNKLERDMKEFARDVKAKKKPTLQIKDVMIARIASAIEEVHAVAAKKSTEENVVKPTMIQLVKALQKKEINVEFATKKGTEEIVGINYIYNDTKISGRNLKRSRLTFQKLTVQEGISYEQVDFRALQKAVCGRTRDVESKEDQHEKKLDKRRSGGNLPGGIKRYEQINADSEIYRGPEYPGTKRLKKKPKKKDEYFAIRVQMQRFHYSIARRMMPPTKFNGQYMLFAFKKPYSEVRSEIQTNFAIELMMSMMAMLQTVFAVFKARCELVDYFDHNPVEDGPLYESHNEEYEERIAGRKNAIDPSLGMGRT
jgi:hypothetical protein